MLLLGSNVECSRLGKASVRAPLLAVLALFGMSLSLLDASCREFVNSPREAGQIGTVQEVMPPESSLPVVSISTDAPAEGVNENKSFKVMIKVSPRPAKGKRLIVNMDVDETGKVKGYFTSKKTNVRVTDTGVEIKTISLTVVHKKGNGEITVSVAPNEKYSVADPPRNQVKIKIIDISTPLISIVSENRMGITEGQVATFSIASTVKSEIPIEVNLRTIQTGNFVHWGVRKVITIDPDRFNAIPYRIVTVDNDTVEESGGEITVRVLDGPNYNVNTDSREAVVAVRDNDGAADKGSRPPKYGVADSVIESILLTIPPTPKGSPNSLTSSRVEDIPIVSVSAADAFVDEGNPITFHVRTSISLSEDILVNLSIEEIGNYIEERASNSVAIVSGSSESRFIVPTVKSDLANHNGIVTVKIISGTGYVPSPNQNRASVEVRDSSDRERRRRLIESAGYEVLSEFHASLAAGSLNAATQRIGQQSSPDGHTSFGTGDFSSLKKMIENGGSSLNDGTLNWRFILGDSSFEFSLLPENSTSNAISVWGKGDFRDLSNEGADGQFYWDGSAFTGLVGIDSRLHENTVVGVAASVNESEAEYDSTHLQNLQIQSKTILLNPYFGFLSESEGMQFQTIVGIGVGEAALHQENGIQEKFASQSYMLAASGKNRLFNSDSCFKDEHCELNLNATTWLAHQSLLGNGELVEEIEANASHFAVKVEGRHQFEISNGTELEPNAFVGVRRDGKANQTTAGMEIGNGILFSLSEHLQVAAESTALISQKFETRQWNHLISMQYDHESDRKGLHFEIAKYWNQSFEQGDFTLWNRKLTNSDLLGISSANQEDFEAKIGFGIALGDDRSLLIPYMNIKPEAFESSYRAGVRIESAALSDFILDAHIQHQNKNQAPNQQLKLSGRIIW